MTHIDHVGPAKHPHFDTWVHPGSDPGQSAVMHVSLYAEKHETLFEHLRTEHGPRQGVSTSGRLDLDTLNTAHAHLHGCKTLGDVGYEPNDMVRSAMHEAGLVEVHCPSCDAPPGQPCRGTTVDVFHSSRRERVQRKLQERA